MFLNLFLFMALLLIHRTIWRHPWLQFNSLQTLSSEIDGTLELFHCIPVENHWSNGVKSKKNDNQVFFLVSGELGLVFYLSTKTFWSKINFIVILTNYHYFATNVFQEDELKGSILVVLANKQDIEGAMSVTEVSQRYLYDVRHVDSYLCRHEMTYVFNGQTQSVWIMCDY